MPLLSFIFAQTTEVVQTTEPSVLASKLNALWDYISRHVQQEGAAFALNVAMAVVIFFIHR